MHNNTAEHISVAPVLTGGKNSEPRRDNTCSEFCLQNARVALWFQRVQIPLSHVQPGTRESCLALKAAQRFQMKRPVPATQ